MKGYKGFNPGLICKDKQYQENTVFEEPEAKIFEKGMRFCENPFDVLDYYDLIRSDTATLALEKSVLKTLYQVRFSKCRNLPRLCSRLNTATRSARKHCRGSLA